MLKPDKLERYIVEDQIMVRTGTIPDGSCFFHAVHYALSETYRNMSQTERMAYIQNIRDRIADFVTIPMVKKLGNGTIWELLRDEFKLDDSGILDAYRHLLRHEWVNEFCWELLQEIYQSNIIVIKEHQIYQMFQNDYRYPNNIFLLWIHDSHYELLGYHIDDVLIGYVVMTQHPFIQKIKLKTNKT